MNLSILPRKSYLSRSGSFDENNCLLKQGRFRVRLTPNPFAGTASFRQTLHLNDGYVSVSSLLMTRG